MNNKFRELVFALRSIPSAGKRNTMFAFVSEGEKPSPERFARNPTAALTILKNEMAGDNDPYAPDLFDECADAVLSGKYILAEFHLFLQHEHLLAELRPQASMQVACQLARGKDARGNVPTSIYGHPPIDYEGLPKDEDL